MTKIDIISGFLGAGKTTFIKKLLEEAISGEQVVLIENEFGEIGIDGGFLKDSGIEIREMNSGCICCSLVGDFGKSLAEVLTIVDVAKCRMYMKNFGEFFNNQIENAGTVVLSRTDITAMDKVNQAVELIREKNPKAVIVTTPCGQLSGAQLLEIIEKPDTMAEDLMKEVEEHRHHHHDHDGGACGCGHDEEACGCGHDHEHHHHHDHDHEAEECGCGHDHEHHHHHDHDHEAEECGCGHDHHHHHDGEACSCGHDHDHHHADEVFTSWGLENVAAMKREDLDRILDELAYGDQYGEVLRAKGMVPGEKEGSWLYFDLVPEQYEIRDGSPEYTGKVCVIGAKLKEDELKKAFGR